MAATSYIGATIALSVATPATVDAAGFGALTYTAFGGILNISESGDTTDDIVVDPLSGRKFHLNGSKDGGNMTLTYYYEPLDAGQNIMRANANGTATISAKILYPDGKIDYKYGVLADNLSNEVATGNVKGGKVTLRVNSATITV